jgi:hypothetical protein
MSSRPALRVAAAVAALSALTACARLWRSVPALWSAPGGHRLHYDRAAPAAQCDHSAASDFPVGLDQRLLELDGN